MGHEIGNYKFEISNSESGPIRMRAEDSPDQSFRRQKLHDLSGIPVTSANNTTYSIHHPLDLIECDGVIAAVVETGSAQVRVERMGVPRREYSGDQQGRNC